MRAQAVAARTYAAYERAHPRAAHYQICDTTSCQVYGGYDAEHPAANAAIDATAGQALLVDGAAGVHAVLLEQRRLDLGRARCRTSPPSADPYDGWAGNPVHTWSVTFADSAIESGVPRDRQPHAAPGHRARRQRRLGRPGRRR